MVYDLRPPAHRVQYQGYPTPEFWILSQGQAGSGYRCPTHPMPPPPRPDGMSRSCRLFGRHRRFSSRRRHPHLYLRSADVILSRAAARVGADRVELYTKPYADRYATDRGCCGSLSRRAGPPIMQVWASMPDMISASGILLFFLPRAFLFYLNEVSIGHALDIRRPLSRHRRDHSPLPCLSCAQGPVICRRVPSICHQLQSHSPFTRFT